MGVAAHDERDYDFAKKFGLRIRRVIKSKDGSDDTLPYCEYGVICNTNTQFDGMTSEEGKVAIVKWLESKNKDNSRPTTDCATGLSHVKDIGARRYL